MSETQQICDGLKEPAHVSVISLQEPTSSTSAQATASTTPAPTQDCSAGYAGPECHACEEDSYSQDCQHKCNPRTTCSGNGRCRGLTGAVAPCPVSRARAAVRKHARIRQGTYTLLTVPCAPSVNPSPTQESVSATADLRARIAAAGLSQTARRATRAPSATLVKKIRIPKTVSTSAIRAPPAPAMGGAEGLQVLWRLVPCPELVLLCASMPGYVRAPTLYLLCPARRLSTPPQRRRVYLPPRI